MLCVCAVSHVGWPCIAGLSSCATSFFWIPVPTVVRPPTASAPPVHSHLPSLTNDVHAVAHYPFYEIVPLASPPLALLPVPLIDECLAVCLGVHVGVMQQGPPCRRARARAGTRTRACTNTVRHSPPYDAHATHSGCRSGGCGANATAVASRARRRRRRRAIGQPHPVPRRQHGSWAWPAGRCWRHHRPDWQCVIASGGDSSCANSGVGVDVGV